VSPERLSDFVRRIRKERHLSLSDISKRSARSGKPISASYINRIENDPTRRVSADRLNALANGLGVPVDELLVYALSKMRPDEADELSLLARFRALSPQRKADVLEIVDIWYSESSQGLNKHVRSRKVNSHGEN
jgi:transcriptional regulator with XRE-family HTH domain